MFDIYKSKFPLVRVGNNGDSGYVVPSLTDFDLYIGGGVGSSYCLENDYDTIKYFDIKNYKIFDATTKDVPDDADPGYIPKNIGIMNTETLTNLTQELADYSNVFLKMDIENCEWNWINFLDYETLNKFKVIVIEMHFIGFPEELGDNDVEMFEKLSAFKKLQKTHRLIHAHGNNYSPHILEFDAYRIPSVSEFTFVKKEYALDEYSTAKLPIDGLDYKNDPKLPDKAYVNIHSK
jgi:hypothetical protein